MYPLTPMPEKHLKNKSLILMFNRGIFFFFQRKFLERLWVNVMSKETS